MKMFIGIVIGLVFGIVLTSAVTGTIPLCQEDEVITATGQCIPLDDADYIGGVGWVAP